MNPGDTYLARAASLNNATSCGQNSLVIKLKAIPKGTGAARADDKGDKNI